MNEKFIWWKGVSLGPFSDEELQSLHWSNVEVIIDSLLKTDFPKTPPLTLDMKDNPNIPHVFCKSWGV